MTNVSPARIVLLVLLGLLAPSDLDGQVRRGRQVDTGPGWAPIAVGPRVGYDQNARGEVLGLHVQLPIVPSGHVGLRPSGDIVFVTGAREYQYGVEVVYTTGGRTGGLFGGGGVGYRDSVIGGTPTEPRSRIFGYSLVAGVSSGVGRFRTQLELRWIFLRDTTLRPVPVTLGLAFPLWGTSRPGSE